MTRQLEVELEDEVYEAIVTRADQLGFESPEAYVAVVLETVIDEVAPLSKKDRDRSLEQNLQDLGYLE